MSREGNCRRNLEAPIGVIRGGVWSLFSFSCSRRDFGAGGLGGHFLDDVLSVEGNSKGMMDVPNSEDPSRTGTEQKRRRIEPQSHSCSGMLMFDSREHAFNNEGPSPT